jgi:hypothetical protein
MRLPALLITVSLVFLSAPGPAAAQDAPATWRLSPRPTLTIGSEGNPRTEFLRIGTVMRLPGGEILVPNRATSEIRVFDRAGRYLRAIGRAGAGPGEFQNLDLVGRAGDTLLIADVNSRITLFLVSGRLVRTIPITARDPVGRFYVAGRLGDGRWAVVAGSTPNIYGPQRTYRDTARVGVIAPDATGTVTWLGEFPGMTFFVHNPDGGPHGDVVGVVPLAPTAVSAIYGDEILIGDTGDNVIGAYSSAGTVLRLITLPLEAKPLTDERIARLRRRAVAQNPSERSRPYLTALHARSVMGKALPVFSEIVPAPDGSLWVLAGAVDSDEPATWLVLDPAGKPKASLQSPAGLRITEVGASYVLGVHTDADGVETVRMYQLTIP